MTTKSSGVVIEEIKIACSHGRGYSSLSSGAIAIMYSCLHFKKKENAPSYTSLQPLSLSLFSSFFLKKKERKKEKQEAVLFCFPSFPHRPIQPLTFSENPVTPSLITFFSLFLLLHKSAASLI